MAGESLEHKKTADYVFEKLYGYDAFIPATIYHSCLRKYTKY